MVPVMTDNEEVAQHFSCFSSLMDFWKNAANEDTRPATEALSVMLRSNGQLNELTSVVLAGLRKSINKFGRV